MMEKPLDPTISIEISQQIKSKAKSPYKNAHKAVLLIEGAIYVQGFIAFAGAPYKPVEHSWLELKDRIADPTLPHLEKNPEEIWYFPAQRLTVKQLKAALEEAQEDYPEDEPLPVYGDAPYEYYGDLMLGGKEYQTAYLEAEAKCQELNKPKSPKPK